MYSVHLAYVCMLVLVRVFIGVVCSVRLGVLCWSAVQCSTQYVADMALHRSYCIVYSAAAVQGESAVTKVTNFSN